MGPGAGRDGDRELHVPRLPAHAGRPGPAHRQNSPNLHRRETLAGDGFRRTGNFRAEKLNRRARRGRRGKIVEIEKIDELVKRQKVKSLVIPAKAGIQFFPPVINSLDSGFHRSDDFLRNHQFEIYFGFRYSNFGFKVAPISDFRNTEGKGFQP